MTSREDLTAFLARIERIHLGIGDLTWTGGLFSFEEFRDIYARPEEWLESALSALSSEAVGDERKTIVALAMQGLPLPALVAFGERVLARLEAGLVSENVFEHAVFPTYDWNTTLQEHPDDPGVQRLLRQVLDSPRVGAQRKQIVKDGILTGQAREDVLRLREAQQIR